MSFIRRRGERDGALSGSTASRAIIDIGSNTVRLVLYGGTMRAPTVLLNEKVAAKLGRDIAANGQLAEEAMDLAMRGLSRFALLLEDLEVSDVETVATAAVRDASNGPEFLARVEDIGLSPRVLSGEEEATLSAHGVAGAFPNAQGIVADLGGGSLELVNLNKEQVTDPVSLPLGALRLPDFRAKGDGGDEGMRKALEKALSKGAGERAQKSTL